MTVTVSVPEESVGDVIGDLNSRRGRPLGMEPKAGMTEVQAEVPMAEMLSYAPDLRAITGGRGDYTMEFARYEEVPAHLAQKVIAGDRRAGGGQGLGGRGVAVRARHAPPATSCRAPPSLRGAVPHDRLEGRCARSCDRHSTRSPATSAGARSSRASGPRRSWPPAASARPSASCAPIAPTHEGWIRESAHGDLPASLRRPSPPPGRSAPAPPPGRGAAAGDRRRPRRRHDADPPPPSDIAADAIPSTFEPSPSRRPAPSSAARAARRSPRTRATSAPCPRTRRSRSSARSSSSTTEHPRTIAGIARTLGEPWVSAVPLEDVPDRGRRGRGLGAVLVPLPDRPGRRRDDPVTLVDKGHELDELDEALRDWNASATPTGGSASGYAPSE